MKNALLIIITFAASLVLGCGSDDAPVIPGIGVRAHTAVIIDNDMYVFGGGTAGAIVNTIWKTDLPTDPDIDNTWTLLEPDPAPEPRAYHAAVEIGGLMYVIGGWNQTGGEKGTFFGDMWKYTPLIPDENGSWIMIDTYDGPAIAGHSAVVYSGSIYIFGGYDGSEYLSNIWECDPDPVLGGCTQLAVTGDAPSGRAYHSATIDDVNGIMYIFGGQSGSTNLNDLWAFTLSTSTWEQLTGTSTNPPAVSYHTAVADGANMYVFGGRGATTNAVWRYNPPIKSLSYSNDEIASTTIAFEDGNPGNDRITDSDNGFIAAGFEAGDVIVVSGSADNDGTYTIITASAGSLEVDTVNLTPEAAGQMVTIVSADIAFVDGDLGNDSITDSKGGFLAAGFEAGDVIVVSGSASNDGTYTIITANPGSLEVDTVSLTPEVAVQRVTIIASGYESNTISFVGNSDSGTNDEIIDLSNDFTLAGFATGDVIVVSGSVNNAGTYTIISATVDTIEVSPESLTSEPAGTPITITDTEHYWTAKNIPSPSPVLRSSHSAVLNGNLMYVFGGFTGALNVSFGDLWQYDLSTNEWQQMSSLPVP